MSDSGIQSGVRGLCWLLVQEESPARSPMKTSHLIMLLVLPSVTAKDYSPVRGVRRCSCPGLTGSDHPSPPV